jgi:hypothetical protein
MQNTNTKFPNTSRITATGDVKFTKSKPLNEVLELFVSCRRGAIMSLNNQPTFPLLSVGDLLVCKAYDYNSNALIFEKNCTVTNISPDGTSANIDSTDSTFGVTLDINVNSDHVTSAIGAIPDTTFSGSLIIKFFE